MNEKLDNIRLDIREILDEMYKNDNNEDYFFQCKSLLKEMLEDLQFYPNFNYSCKLELEKDFYILYVVYRLLINNNNLKSKLYKLILNVYDLKNSKEVK